MTVVVLVLYEDSSYTNGYNSLISNHIHPISVSTLTSWSLVSGALNYSLAGGRSIFDGFPISTAGHHGYESVKD
jgi:hypothetical protein